MAQVTALTAMGVSGRYRAFYPKVEYEYTVELDIILSDINILVELQ